MKKLNKVLEEIVEPTTDMVLYAPSAKSSEVYSPDHIDPDQKDEEPKYMVSYDPVKDGGDGSISVTSFKVENGISENINPHKFSMEKILDTLRAAYEANSGIKGKLVSIKDSDEVTDENYGIDLKWRPKGYGEEWGIVSKPKSEERRTLFVGNPAPSMYDFLEHGRKMEMHVINAMGVPIDYIGHISSFPTHPIVDILSELPYVKNRSLYNSLKGRKLAKRRKFKLYSFYVHNKLMK